ncbi:MAG: ABC transporter permease [Streptomycetaceae bacterium]|nr:MAG: ABC transporter permease [Streptomycetaceae bacterium]
MHKIGWLRAPLYATLAFLYLPIAVLMFMSFNASDAPFTWTGFSTKWYSVLLHSPLVIEGFKNTLIVAVIATVMAVILGTLLAIGIARYQKSSILEAIALTPAIFPDLALAIGLLALFATFKLSLGLHSVILSHALFCSAFVTAIVRGRLAQIDSSLEEAAQDLGDSQVGIFFRITLPSLKPAIIAGALLSFTLSLDEFVIAFFTDGPSTPTLPIVIYSMVRFGVSPEINALATLVLLVSIVIVIIAQRNVKVQDSL